jgi:hypothetical protein
MVDMNISKKNTFSESVDPKQQGRVIHQECGKWFNVQNCFESIWEWTEGSLNNVTKSHTQTDFKI